MDVDFSTLDKPEILITAGGSGGHVTVALAVIDELKKLGAKVEKMLFVGSNLTAGGDRISGSVEQKMVSKTDIPFLVIRSGKLQRSFSLQSIGLLFSTIGGFIDSFKLFLKVKPKLIVSFGGYVTLPVCIVAKFFGIPIILHEQTAAIGLTNNVVAKFAKEIFVNFRSSIQYFDESKATHVGNPLRTVIFSDRLPLSELTNPLKRLSSRQPELPLVYITGGGQGSHMFNQFVTNNLKPLLEKYRVILQTGSNEICYADMISIKKKILKLPIKLQRRILVTDMIFDEIGYVYANSDVVVSRGGAGSVTEFGALKKRSIIIPIKWVTHNEQYKNAKILSDIGLAKILDEDNLTLTTFFMAIDEALKLDLPSDELLRNMFPVDAAYKMAKNIVEKYQLT
ncbi:UDP-N-acetylglucosamine--N-acetylmuramyl-(pentapeptide) pyrophosphoryl-undecaprenol N-acetylglucosamine transferase [Candidatus Dojkabacteria bacterium]|nr:UDP-N-acetylglucosamine--N-acetylmuramyl-(pentapeptide) pyrophosphoryl-undecaprenol N-acetylglucosamine transferase [Candidatus Dojkabacteria bacterium]